MQVLDNLLDIYKIIVDTPLLYESSLVNRDEVLKFRGKPVGHKLSYNFCKAVRQAYGPIIRDFYWIALLRDQDHQSLVEEL
jgi:hypothetical protein